MRSPPDYLPSALAWSRRQLLHYITDGEARWLAPWWKLLKAFNVSSNDCLGRHLQEYVTGHPVAVVYAFGRPLERIGAQVVQHWHTQFCEVPLPDPDWSFRIHFGVLLHQGYLPVTHAKAHQVA